MSRGEDGVSGVMRRLSEIDDQLDRVTDGRQESILITERIRLEEKMAEQTTLPEHIHELSERFDRRGDLASASSDLLKADLETLRKAANETLALMTNLGPGSQYDEVCDIMNDINDQHTYISTEVNRRDALDAIETDPVAKLQHLLQTGAPTEEILELQQQIDPGHRSVISRDNRYISGQSKVLTYEQAAKKSKG